MSARSTNPESPDRRAELIETLADGIDRLVTTEAWQDYLDVQARFHAYSFSNTMLIFSQRPRATQVMAKGKQDGSTGWMSLGREVIEGERPIWVWAPAFRKETDPETGEDGRRVYFVAVKVYDIAQTEGAELPHPARKLTGEAPEGMIARVVAYISSIGYDVEFLPVIPGSAANGDTTYGLRRVRVATEGRSTMGQLKTLLHEAGHALLHENSDAPAELKELEAESVAYVAAAALGADTSDYTFGYVLTWMGGSPRRTRKAIKTSGARIQKTARQIIDGMPADSAVAPAGSGIAEDVAA